MHGDFPNKLLYSRLGLSAVQASEPTSKTRGNTLLVLLLLYVTYRIVHCIGTTVSGYVSYHGKMYHCRPITDANMWWFALFVSGYISQERGI